MAALTAASWTVTISTNEIHGRKRRITGTLALAGTDTYPTGGVPLPAIDKLGMKRQLDAFDITGNNDRTTEYLYRWAKTAHKLLMYVSHDTAGVTTLPMDEEDAAGVPGPRTLNFVAEGW